jgi:hypothetical protein
MNDEEAKLYSTFKETNWWARHPQAWKKVICTYLLMLAPLVMSVNLKMFSPQILLGGALLLFLLPFLLLCVKIVYHDSKWKKFQEDFHRGCMSNVGGILKIYD